MKNLDSKNFSHFGIPQNILKSISERELLLNKIISVFIISMKKMYVEYEHPTKLILSNTLFS